MNILDRFFLAITSIISAPYTPNKDAEIDRMTDRHFNTKES